MIPLKYGSEENPSGKRPPYGTLPRGLATGPMTIRPGTTLKIRARLTVDEIVSHEVELATRRLSLILHVLTVPCHGQSVAHREPGDVVLVVYTSEAILVLESSPSEIATVDISTSDQGNLLSSGELRRECFRLLVSIFVNPKVGCHIISVLFV